MRYLRQISEPTPPAIFVCILLGSCASVPPPAASSNLRLTPEEQKQKLTLSAVDRTRIGRALAKLAGGHDAVDPPRAAPLGVRWRDVPLAMHYATAEVEMAIARTVEQAGGYTFVIRTIDDRPGAIVVRQTGDDRIYEARATIGRFEDAAAAAALEAAFDRQMRAFGKKRWFVYGDD